MFITVQRIVNNCNGMNTKKCVVELEFKNRRKADCNENPDILKPNEEAFLKKIHLKKPVFSYLKFAQEHFWNKFKDERMENKNK